MFALTGLAEVRCFRWQRPVQSHCSATERKTPPPSTPTAHDPSSAAATVLGPATSPSNLIHTERPSKARAADPASSAATSSEAPTLKLA